VVDHAPVDAVWCLVDATHVDAAERAALASSAAVVGSCPATEASLREGVFNAPACLGAGAAWGIGSDSHASADAAE
jgi:formimidoylglutamate deiminase